MTTLDATGRDRARVLAAQGRLAPIRDEYPFAPRFLDVDGGAMHYVDEGPREAEVLLCVHGNPTWSFAFRRIVRAFSPTHRVVAVDHVGCGLSDKPESWPYRLEGHATNLVRLVEALDLRRVTLVLHDWGGAIGMGCARRVPERIDRVFVMNTAAFRSKRMPWRIRACRIPRLGPWLVTEWNAFAGLAPILAVHDRHKLAFPAKRGLLLPYETPRARLAIARFVLDIPMSPAHPSWSELVATEEALASFADRPVGGAWGERDWCFTPRFRAEWERRFPKARIARCRDAGHFVFEEDPDAVERALRDLVAVPAPRRA